MELLIFTITTSLLIPILFIFLYRELTIRNAQRRVVDQIISQYKKHGNVVCYLYGPGVTSIPNILASKMEETCKNVHHIDSYNPIESGNSFSALYGAINPSEDSPIIIVLKNADSIIKSIHDGIPRHNYLHIDVTDKYSLNTFLDRLNDGLFKNVIFIMTSNLPVANIMKLDVR